MAAMTISLGLIGIYMVINYFAPDIFVRNPGEKYAIEQAATKGTPEKNLNIMRIPSVGINVMISEKVTEGGAVYKWTGKTLNLSAKQRVLGATPWETLRLSSVYQSWRIKNQDKIYIDIDGNRTVYVVKEVKFNVPLSKPQQADLTIYVTTDDDPERAVVLVEAGRQETEL